jgi:hypothetical protein
MRRIGRTPRGGAIFVFVILALASASGADPSPELRELRLEVERLARENARMQDRIQTLEGDVRDARDEARAAQDAARAPLPAVGAPPGAADPYAAAQGQALLSQPLGARSRLQLLDVSLDVLAAGGGSSATDDELETLQGGGHDPNQRGFTLQNVELSLLGAVDPFLTGEAHLIYFIDPEGESNFEVEEAFARTQRLPFGLEEHGLELEVGQFFTEFGRINPQHPHQWHWQDQPVVNTRFFGADGMRQTGVRAGWLTPLPWFSELHAGVQNAKGETMVSFLANDEVFEERAIGGRPFGDERVGSPNDLLKLLRWVNAVDLSDTWSTQLGLSGVHGPNATGPDGSTLVYGADWVVKWRPLQTDRGWPFVLFESEIMRREYRADDFFGCPVEEEDGACPVAETGIGREELRDWGFYAQLLWGFRRGWAGGLRFEHATGSGSDVAFDDAAGSFVRVSRDTDPFRADRTRVSPLLVFHPSEFSRLRLQYNYDVADDLDEEHQHSVWAGIEFLFGAHPAHGY